MFTTIFKTLYAHSTELSFTDLRCNYDNIYEVYTDSSEITMVSVTVSNHDVLIKFSNELTYDVNVAIFVNALEGQFIPVTSYNQLTDLPILFDGDYDSLTNKPDIPQDASELSCVNPDTLEDDTTQNVLDMVFQSVSDGKELIADAITDKGIPTSASDTFATMANNIGQISGGEYIYKLIGKVISLRVQVYELSTSIVATKSIIINAYENAPATTGTIKILNNNEEIEPINTSSISDDEFNRTLSSQYEIPDELVGETLTMKFTNLTPNVASTYIIVAVGNEVI